MKRNGIARLAQTFSLLFFLFLLGRMVWPLPASSLPADLFLHLDPLVSVAVPLAAREIIPGLWLGLIPLLAAILAGRLFCGYICPMGATLDLARFLLGRLSGSPARRGKGRGSVPGGESSKTAAEAVSPPAAGIPDFRQAKYLILAVILGAALAGVNLVFWAAPLVLITRLFALVLHPLALLAGQELLPMGRLLAVPLHLPDLAYAQIALRRFDTVLFVAVFFAVLFLLERVRPRFWCRYCCPAGALLGICSLRPLWRRRVRTCIRCGRCAGECPAGAITDRGLSTLHPECLVCRKCADVCPAGGTSFSCREGAAARGGCPAGEALPSRRVFLAAAGSGAVLAAVEMSGARSLLRGDPHGLLWPAACIRPPGALPEPDFLVRCIRCGQCMKACPTNGLQPAWFGAGPEGMFSPLLAPRRGPCEPDCHVCGSICPTRAITPLIPEEKYWAKVGTAVVDPGRCLAWAEGRRCVVCEEVCPYGAVAVIQDSRARFGLPVPVVRPERCFGCGYCEYYCPVRVPAIAVQPLGALRLADSRYAAAGRAAGLLLQPAGKDEVPDGEADPLPEGIPPPGFTSENVLQGFACESLQRDCRRVSSFRRQTTSASVKAPGIAGVKGSERMQFCLHQPRTEG
jgi:MauM/NapG family ferredoxin protein